MRALKPKSFLPSFIFCTTMLPSIPLLTTECVISDKPKKEEAHSHAPMGGGGMGDMGY